MRRALLALTLFALFVVAVVLFRGDGSDLEVTATPSGPWNATRCDAIPDGSGLEQERARCLGSDGMAAFELTITNAGDAGLAVTACTVGALTPDGDPFDDGEPIVVPIRSVLGAPSAAAHLDPGSSISMTWFVPWLGPDEAVRYEATCGTTPATGPPPS